MCNETINKLSEKLLEIMAKTASKSVARFRRTNAIIAHRQTRKAPSIYNAFRYKDIQYRLQIVDKGDNEALFNLTEI